MSDQEFVVKDRRRFSPDGEPREEETKQPAQEGPQAAETSRGRPRPDPAAEKTCGGPPPLPEVNFSTFVFSLSTSALMHLGEIPDPQTGDTCLNLPLAKQTIDILGMLKEKTGGNLSEDEESLLTNLLYELRLKYVALVRK
ncbi:MAG: DUF1844 domain-containing protein [Thermodesulfobacteriota bacterium]